MSVSLARRIYGLVRQELDGYPGAWMVWCDPTGNWAPLLQRVAADRRLGGFSLLIADETAGEAGSPLVRRQLQERLDAEEGLVLLAKATPDELGWLWAQALRAERIYTRPLRDQLLEWGWRPQSLTIAEDELAALARHHLAQDPQNWGGGGLQPDLPLLRRVLSGVAEPDDESRLMLDATIEATGLPPLDLDNLPRWRTRALARLLVTQAHHVAPGAVGDGHDLLIPAGHRGLALDLLGRWADSYSLRDRLAVAIVEADKMAALGSIAGSPPLGSAPSLSRAAETAAFSAVCRGLAQLTGKDLLESLASRHDDLARRAEGFWGATQDAALSWSEAARLAAAARAVVDASPEGDWPSPQQAITWYQNGGWRLDRAGEELLRTLAQPHPDLVALIAPLREAYRNRWEDLLMRWSATWVAAGCPIPALPSAAQL